MSESPHLLARQQTSNSDKAIRTKLCYFLLLVHVRKACASQVPRNQIKAGGITSQERPDTCRSHKRLM